VEKKGEACRGLHSRNMRRRYRDVLFQHFYPFSYLIQLLLKPPFRHYYLLIRYLLGVRQGFLALHIKQIDGFVGKGFYS
jgi:hypothetical protein